MDVKITVTQDEIAQTHELLCLLDEWKALTRISGQYNRGEVSLSIDGNGGKVRIAHSVDAYGVRNHPVNTAVQKCNQEIELMLGTQAQIIAEKAINIIKSHLPIPVDC